MDIRHCRHAARPRGAFPVLVVRRHVDLLRVSSALCPGTETSPGPLTV
ncbi:putative leader peptide [Actinacidiphila sp. ITFR-21]